MISEREINEAIATMQGQRHPDATTCLMLASYLTIRRELFPQEQSAQIDRGYSYDGAPLLLDSAIPIDSGSDFCAAVRGKSPRLVWARIDEIMTGLKVINPDLYKRILRDVASI